MKPRRLILTGFMAGELDPHLDGRVDAEQYAFGLAECQNWVAINEGPLVKRTGFERIAAADASSTWLTGFRPSIEQEYVLEWGEEKLRFFTNEARLETSPGVAYEITTPFLAAEVPAISQQQNFERLYCAHRNHAPSAVRRDSPSTFTLETTDNLEGPFLDENTDETRIISVSAVSGTTNIVGNGGFTADHVGSLFKIEAKDFANIAQWEVGMKDVAIGDLCHNEGNVYEAITAGTTGQVQPTHTEGAYFDGFNKKDLLNDKGPYGVKWQFRHGRFGIVRITAVTNASAASGTVIKRLPDSLTTVASYRWAHQAFSKAAGWPHLVAIYKGRLIHCTDLDVVGSVAGDYGGGRVNYAAFTSAGRTAEDLGFRRTIGFQDPPLWIRPDRKLLVGTPSVEMAIGPFNSSQVFSGTNIEAEPQSFYGSELVWPVTVGTETIFVERGGRRCRSSDYDFGRDRYVAVDLNATSRHITQGQVVQLGYQRTPYSLVFGVRGDGQMIVHAKTRAEISGFTRWKLGGGARVLSSVSIVGSDGVRGDIWVLIERENGVGATVKEIWKQSPWRELGDDQKEAFYVDGGVRIAASAGQTEFTGLDHLAGQTVAVLADGFVVPGMSVASDGSLTLPEAPAYAFTLIVGLGYTAIARTMRPELRDGRESNTGLRQRAVKAITRVLETLGLGIAAPGQETPEALTLRRGGQSMDQPVPVYSGDTDGLIDGDFDREGRVTWISDAPLPATITLAALNIDVSVADA